MAADARPPAMLATPARARAQGRAAGSGDAPPPARAPQLGREPLRMARRVLEAQAEAGVRQGDPSADRAGAPGLPGQEGEGHQERQEGGARGIRASRRDSPACPAGSAAPVAEKAGPPAPKSAPHQQGAQATDFERMQRFMVEGREERARRAGGLIAAARQLSSAAQARTNPSEEQVSDRAACVRPRAVQARAPSSAGPRPPPAREGQCSDEVLPFPLHMPLGTGGSDHGRILS
ncbi:unnamed protein product [Prorocentrum cordatum]|uniref:Uncharacterized protein n=1 Tax=Prorocentrum cordatum TaxID=2364126 RepID=A0ABN9QU45_9DINO|nr:unnamed protein product [Polarella glacialis]